MSLAPSEPLAGGSVFWENLSLESLVEEDLFLLIGRAAGVSSTTTTNTSTTTPSVAAPIRPQRPTSIALPSPPRMPAATKSSSPLSPKLYSWNFLRRNNGAHSSPASSAVAAASSSSSTGKTSLSASGLSPNSKFEVASAPPRAPRRSLALPQGTTLDLEEARQQAKDASAISASGGSPVKPVRPGQSRSSTWTDNLPSVRTLSHGQDLPPPPPLPQTLQPTTSRTSSASSRLLAVQESVLLVPIVSPRKDNQARGGRFGLFRRGSLSPRVEKMGFFIGGRTGEEKERRRQDKTAAAAVKEGSHDGKLAKRRHRGSFGSFTSLGARPSSPMSSRSGASNLWGPRAEELRHVALTTASPPSEEPVGAADFEPGSFSSDAASQHSYFAAAVRPPYDLNARLASIPRSPLQHNQPSDLHQSPVPPLTLAGSSSGPVCQSPLRQSVDLPLEHPHIIFGTPQPASPLRASAGFSPSHSDSSFSMPTSDSDEDFPTRSGARKAVKAKRLHKASVKIGRERSCSPLRYEVDPRRRGTWDAAAVSVSEGLDLQGEDSRGRIKAWQWWRPAGGAAATGLAQVDKRGRPVSMLGSSAPTPSSSVDRTAKRGKSANLPPPRVSQLGFKVTSRPVTEYGLPRNGFPPGSVALPPTPPPSNTSLNPTPSAAVSRDSSPAEHSNALLSSSRPPAFTRQSTGGVSIRSSVALREWQPPAKAAPPPPTSRSALPPVNTSATAAVRKDSLSPPTASSFDPHSPISAYGTATEGEEMTNSEQELGTAEDVGGGGGGGLRGHAPWQQPRIRTADSMRSADSESILMRVESRTYGVAPGGVKA